MILIVGATSTPGKVLLPLLLDKGYCVRALTRSPEKLAPHRSPNLETWRGDLRRPATISDACEGVEAVVSAVTGFPAAGDNNPRSVDAAGNRFLMEAALRAGVRHFVLVSGLGAGPAHPHELGRIRYETEVQLRSLTMDYTILRPAAYMEKWCLPIGEDIYRGRRFVLPQAALPPCNFISAADVARFIIVALEDPRLRNQALDLAGPDSLTLDAIVALYEKVLHKRASCLRLPAFASDFLNRTGPSREARDRAGRLWEITAAADGIDMIPVLEKYPVSLTRLEALVDRQFTISRDGLPA